MGKFASKIEVGSSRCTSNGPSPYFGSLPVWAWSITGTGIQKWCQYWYWHYTLVQYQYLHGPLMVLVFKNGARTSIGIFAVWFSTSMGTVKYWYWHSMMPVPVLAFLHFDQHGHTPLPELAFNSTRTSTGIFALGSVPVWAHSITGTDNR
jgi:hypothetical protein